ncbi:RAC-gamma serine/threonine-protein kinase [Tritrichomonas musculus]|uniref:non-specific serine/threonine protein kinase n=1 Tax=Tritrichomonas musculus TaxID=1915356 RepID=A0ABR2HJN9_9EUKA
MSKTIKEGWMTKLGGTHKSWKKRWFTLVGTKLTYYVDQTGKKEKGTIDLKQATGVDEAPEAKKPNSFKIVVPSKRTFILICNNEQEKKEWMSEIKKVISGDSGSKAASPSKASASSPSSPAPPKTGVASANTIDDFTPIRVLGRGTYGKVMLVRCKKDGQLYAMKSMSKKILQETGQTQQTLHEKDVLLKTVHPFLVFAHSTFQTGAKIFIILDYVPGGELFGRLKEEGQFNEDRTRLYAAEILLGLGFLHSKGLIYRDLKPENILVDAQGHAKITDFGLVKEGMNAKSTTTTFCGTPEYIAPEMLQQQPYTKSVDWWAFGILVFEMLTGMPPFYDENVNKMYRMVISADVDFPSFISGPAKDLITQLLSKDPDTRLGSGEDDYKAIQKHPFFKSLNWDDVLSKKYKPEWVPQIKEETDTTNFDTEFTTEEAVVSYEDASLIDQNTQDEFNGFTCVRDSGLAGT